MCHKTHTQMAYIFSVTVPPFFFLCGRSMTTLFLPGECTTKICMFGRWISSCKKNWKRNFFSETQLGVLSTTKAEQTGEQAGSLLLEKTRDVVVEIGEAFVSLFARGPSKGLPWCRYGLHCRHCYLTPKANATHKEHVAAFMHVCPYGQSCREISDAHHTKLFWHMAKEPCRHFAAAAGGGKDRDKEDPMGCTKLADVHHRASFHHSGLYDVLFPCRDGMECTVKGDTSHCQQYTHGNVQYSFSREGKLVVKIGSSPSQESSSSSSSSPSSSSSSSSSASASGQPAKNSSFKK